MEENPTTEKLARALASYVIELIDASKDRMQHRVACASNWMFPSTNEKIPYEYAQRNYPRDVELVVQFAPAYEPDDPAGTAVGQRYALRLVTGTVGSVLAKFILADADDGKVFVRYSRTPTLSDAFNDAARAQRGEFP